ncbi:hypothetical protein [Ureaplasma urealyticum]|uniref:Lipoprotein n=2 Tax=Ureaplasma urealyticum TaxID=2130 RepID=A0AAP9ACD8_UREUR|nr:hypothetical protein [Ureaplasma urealyticum]EDX53594.1 putative lipoprotein [Ureaplasma urealyticum serovar 9 str. ATCC 33175]EDU06028.1 putative lipoprotein [Ureaplasma urealyticum serovar 5 str. ATCC 27817]EDU56685.1 putative lipoprotein [Ureaplasma urealyticum serovar 7 str. ATCC 27819]EDU67105.1 putative lipoprotein [Ureaplasma urealyticum serovar 11 str. ATCC 33695]EDX53493.1 putative lipoprotein [Ureaplasma urealyticum serovar 12 str. ATCC 33696]
MKTKSNLRTRLIAFISTILATIVISLVLITSCSTINTKKTTISQDTQVKFKSITNNSINLANEKQILKQTQDIETKAFYNLYESLKLYFEQTIKRSLYLYYSYNFALLNLYNAKYHVELNDFSLIYNKNQNNNDNSFDVNYQVSLVVDDIGDINIKTKPQFYEPIPPDQKVKNEDYRFTKKLKNFWFGSKKAIIDYFNQAISMRINYSNVKIYRSIIKYPDSKDHYEGYTMTSGSLYRWFKQAMPIDDNQNKVHYMINEISDLNVDDDVKLFNLNDTILKQVFVVDRIPEIPIKPERDLVYTNIWNNSLNDFNFSPIEFLVPTFIKKDAHKITPLNSKTNKEYLNNLYAKVLVEGKKNNNTLIKGKYVIYNMYDYFDLTLEPEKPGSIHHCHADGYCH